MFSKTVNIFFANLFDSAEYNGIITKQGRYFNRSNTVKTTPTRRRMREMKKTLFSALALSLIINISVNASQQMAIWDFGPNAAGYTTAPTAENVIGTPTLVLSGGTLDPDGKDGVVYVDVLGVSHIKGQAAAWDDVKISSSPDAKWIVTLDTIDWSNISVRFDYKAWDPGTTSFDLSYQLDNTGTWIKILDDQTIIADQTYHSFTSGILSDIVNQSSVQLKFSDLDKTGNDKFAFDNFELSGTQIPEPATILLLGLGVSAILRKRVK